MKQDKLPAFNTPLVVCLLFSFSLRQETPLHVAAREGNMDAAQFLIRNGADVNIKDKDGVGRLVLLIAFILRPQKFTRYIVHSY